ncbi:hypothetical protein ABFA07_009811 [Porites harrisoni]
MKKTPLPSKPTSFSGQNKRKHDIVKSRNAGSLGSATQELRQVSSRNASVSSALSSPETETQTGVKERQLQKCHLELQQLKRENSELKAELLFIRSLYKQLVEETPLEKFDERRVNLLKSQVIQLERQVLLQSSALQARQHIFLEVENKLLNLRETVHGLYPSDSSSNYMTVSREYVQKLEYRIEELRIHLYKNKENTECDDLCLPALYMGDFLKQSKDSADEAVTLLDCCSGKVDHLNLKHVSKLESKLCKLYKNMVCLMESLQNHCSPTSVVLKSEHVAQPIRERLAGHVTAVSDMLRDCCEDLLCLSILYPAAPWPPLKKVIREDLTEENVMSHMPDLSRKKLQEVRSVVQAVMKTMSYLKHMLSLEIKILKEELSFHQQVYECQNDYVESLLSAVRQAYGVFEGNLIETLCKPLEETLTAYTELKDTASEESLKRFLSVFKDNATQLSDAVESLKTHKQEDHEGVKALSEFHTHFVDSLQSITRKCVAKRDTLMKKLLEAKDAGINKTTASTTDNTSSNSSKHGQSGVS